MRPASRWTSSGPGEQIPQLEGLPKSLEEQMGGDQELPTDPEGTAIAQRATAEATLGVANVNDLVMSMPKLATFTPAPPARLQDAVVYVRGGALWRAQTEGISASSVKRAGLVPAWARHRAPPRT